MSAEKVAPALGADEAVATGWRAVRPTMIASQACPAATVLNHSALVSGNRGAPERKSPDQGRGSLSAKPAVA